MRILHRLGGDHAAREAEALRFVGEVLLAPHSGHDFDGLAPVVPGLLPVHPEGRLLHGCGPSGAPFHAAAGEDVDGGDLLGDALGRGEGEGGQGDAEAEADPLGEPGQVAEEHLGGRAVRAAFAEVVLDRPDGTEAHPVGEPYLFHRLPVGALLGGPLAVRVGSLPGPRHVDLVEHVQIHAGTLRQI